MSQNKSKHRSPLNKDVKKGPAKKIISAVDSNQQPIISTISEEDSNIQPKLYGDVHRNQCDWRNIADVGSVLTAIFLFIINCILFCLFFPRSNDSMF